MERIGKESDMKKKEKKPVVLLGRKHVWTDTQGHAHRVVFDEKVAEKPKFTWVVLAVVTFVALVLGVVGVLTTPERAASTGKIFVTEEQPSFVYKTTIRADADARAHALAAGWNNEFFLADDEGVTLYAADGTKLDFWQNELEDESPTALTFASDQNAATNGTLIVAYTDKVKALRFSLDRVAPGEGNDVIFTARGGAKGAPKLVLNANDADIRGLACSSERLFVADFRTGRVYRYTWKKLDALKDDLEKSILPDCIIGDPDVSSAYPGLKPALKEKFSVVYLPSENELFAANSGLFRVDSFNAGTGVYRAEHSQSHQSDASDGFTGAANPIAIAVSFEKWIATAETGDLASSETPRRDPIRFFSLTGTPLGSLAQPDIPRPDETFVVDVATSPDSRWIYALYSNGDVDVWERAK